MHSLASLRMIRIVYSQMDYISNSTLENQGNVTFTRMFFVQRKECGKVHINIIFAQCKK